MLIKTEHGIKPRYTTPSMCKDFAGNLFIAACYFDDENHYNGEMRLFKVTPQGTVSVLGERPMTRAKGDGVGICQSGSDILVVMGGHVGDPDTDLELLQAFTGVAVAYPAGMQPGNGGAQGFTEGDTGGEPVDYDRIAQIVDQKVTAALTELRNEFGGNIRQGIEDKAKDAIRELQVLTLPLTRAGGDAGYYQQQINTAYTGAKGAIHDSSGFGGGHSAQAPTGAPQPGLPDTFTERSGMSGIYEGEDQ